MTVCAVKGCHNQSAKHKKDAKIGYHTFPSDSTEAARWIEKLRLNRNESCWKPSKNTKICSIHFNDNVKYVTKSGLCRLRLGAIPTKGLHIACERESHNREDNISDSDNVLPSQLTVSGPSSIKEAPTTSNAGGASTIKYEENAESNDDPLQIPRCASPSGLSDIGSSDLEGALDTPVVILLKKKLREYEEKLREKDNLLRDKDEKLRERDEKIESLQMSNKRLKEKNSTIKELLVKMKRKLLILKHKAKDESVDKDLELSQDS